MCSFCVKLFTKPNEDLLKTTDIGEKYALGNKTGKIVENKIAKAFASIHDMELIGKGKTKSEDDIINNLKEFDQSRMEKIEGF